ncbi:MAG: hypothetical protein ACRETO_00920 [Gammaproteobacteria bacterium]
MRPLIETDIPAIARLYLKVYGDKYKNRQKSLQRDLSMIMLENPWRDEDIRSLVFEDDNSYIIGCVGVVPRPMMFDGRRITAAVTHSFMVEPGSRSTLAAVHLARKFFSGPQNLSLADVNDASRRIWESAGGTPSRLYGLCWIRLLRPSRYVLTFLQNRGLPAGLTWILSPICQMVDGLSPFIFKRLFKLRRPKMLDDTLDAGVLSAMLPRFTQLRRLVPEYAGNTSTWLFNALEQNTRYGIFQRRQVLNGEKEIIGWYVYFLKSSGVAEVAQLVTTRESAGAVLENLFFHARKHGAVAITGQVDPTIMDELSGNHCIFYPIRNGWVMMHSKSPEILQSIHAGQAFLTRLESEWWISSILG